MFSSSINHEKNVNCDSKEVLGIPPKMSKMSITYSYSVVYKVCTSAADKARTLNIFYCNSIIQCFNVVVLSFFL